MLVIKVDMVETQLLERALHGFSYRRRAGVGHDVAVHYLNAELCCDVISHISHTTPMFYDGVPILISRAQASTSLQGNIARPLNQLLSLRGEYPRK